MINQNNESYQLEGDDTERTFMPQIQVENNNIIEPLGSSSNPREQPIKAFSSTFDDNQEVKNIELKNNYIDEEEEVLKESIRNESSDHNLLEQNSIFQREKNDEKNEKLFNSPQPLISRVNSIPDNILGNFAGHLLEKPQSSMNLKVKNKGSIMGGIKTDPEIFIIKSDENIGPFAANKIIGIGSSSFISDISPEDPVKHEREFFTSENFKPKGQEDNIFSATSIFEIEQPKRKSTKTDEKILIKTKLEIPERSNNSENSAELRGNSKRTLKHMAILNSQETENESIMKSNLKSILKHNDDTEKDDDPIKKQIAFKENLTEIVTEKNILKSPSSISNFWKTITTKRGSRILPEGKTRENPLTSFKFGVLKVVSAAGKFRNLIKNKRNLNLNLDQLNIINDQSYFRDGRETQGEGEQKTSSGLRNSINLIGSLLVKFFQSSCSFLGQKVLRNCWETKFILLRKIKLFNPKAKWKMAWDSLNMIMIFWNFMIISIAISFGVNTEDVFLLSDSINRKKEWHHLFLVLSFLNMVIDILLTMNTQYYDKGVFVRNRRKIFKYYINNNLAIDLVTGIPFFCQIISYYSEIDANVVKYINCLFFLKYFNLKGVFKALEELLSMDDKYEAFFSLMKLFFKIFFVAHLMACLWHSVAFFGRAHNDKTWLLKKGLSAETFWLERYIYSIYFCLTTMTTVGYGDISPENQSETFVAMLTMLVGSAMFGYSINSIGELLKKMNKKEDELKKNFTLLDRYMKSKRIGFELQARARKYLEFVWNEEKVANIENTEEILQKLSSNIREEVLLQSNGKFLLQYPMLCKNFSEKTMRKLINIIKPIRFSPEEIIVEEGDASFNPVLYMVAQGEIEICLKIQKRDEELSQLKILKEGTSFGDISFFTDLPQEFTARSLNYSTVYILSKRDLLEIIGENNDDWEKFCMIRDKILLYQNYEDLYLKCFSCSAKHLIRECPAIGYIPNKSKIISILQSRIKKIKNQRRKLMKMRSKKYFGSLQNIFEVQSSAKRIQMNILSSKNDQIHPNLISMWSNEELIKGGAKTPELEMRTLNNNETQSKEENLLSRNIFISDRKEVQSFRARKGIALQKISTDNNYKKTNDNKRRNGASELSALLNPHEIKDLLTAENPDPKRSDSLQTYEEQKENSRVINNSDNDIKPQNEKLEELFIMNFDYHKNYNKYFVHNNPDNVIINLALKMKQMTKKKLAQILSKPKYLNKTSSFEFPKNDSKNLQTSAETPDKNFRKLASKKNFFQGD